MKKIVALTDYKGHFGSKWDAVPYNSGFDKELLHVEFEKVGFDIEYIPLSKVKFRDIDRSTLVIYTSSEDVGYHYKDYIEDIIAYLEIIGVNVIPAYKYLRANNNKVFMELLRDVVCDDSRIAKLDSWVFGTLEELEKELVNLKFPIVIKTAKGAMSKGVSLASDKKDLIEKVKRISRTTYIYQDIKDRLRPIKHKNYTLRSLYREKFILQTFIPNLKNDWKILIFGTKYFILTRYVAKGDFRASGSHTNYLAGTKSILPDGLLDFAQSVFEKMKVPHLSIDVVYDGKRFYLVEFQALYFGTSTINMSDVYFEKTNEKWEPHQIQKSVENFYVNGISWYLKKQ